MAGKNKNPGPPLVSVFRGDLSLIPKEFRAKLGILQTVQQQPVDVDADTPDGLSLVESRVEQERTDERKKTTVRLDGNIDELLIWEVRLDNGQVATATRRLVPEGTDLTVDELTASATQNNLGTGLLDQTVVQAPSVFPGLKYSISIPDLVPAALRGVVPTTTVEVTIAGMIVFPTLGVGELSRSEEQLTVGGDGTKRIVVVGRAAGELPVGLVGQELTTQFGGGILDVYNILDNEGIMTVDAALGVTESAVTPLGNGQDVKLTKVLHEGPWPLLVNRLFDEEMQVEYTETQQTVPAGTEPYDGGTSATANLTLSGGAVTNATIVSGGTGYLSLPTFSFYVVVDNTFTVTVTNGDPDIQFPSSIAGIVRVGDKFQFTGASGNLATQVYYWVKSVNTGANTFTVAHSLGGATITPDFSGTPVYNAPAQQINSTNIFVGDSSLYAVGTTLSHSLDGTARTYFVAEIVDAGHISLTSSLGGVPITWQNTIVGSYQIIPTFADPPILTPTLTATVLTGLTVTDGGSGLPSGLKVTISDPFYAFSSEVKVVDFLRSTEIITYKEPTAISEATAIVTEEWRPFSFPGLFYRTTTCVGNQSYFIRKAVAELTQMTIKTWWIKSATKPLIQVDEIIAGSLVATDTSFEGNGSFVRIENVLHDDYYNYNNCELYNATTPTYTEYFYGIPDGTTTDHNFFNINGLDVGSGYTPGDILSVGIASLEVTVVGVSNSIVSWQVLDEGVGGSYTNPITASGGTGTGAKFNVYPYSTVNFAPDSAWINNSRIVGASVRRTPYRNLWKIETQNVVMR